MLSASSAWYAAALEGNSGHDKSSMNDELQSIRGISGDAARETWSFKSEHCSAFATRLREQLDAPFDLG